MVPNQTPAQEYREIAGRFTTLVEAVPDDAWAQPAPPEGSTAREVVRHLVEWFPPFLADGAGIKLPSGPAVDRDPVGLRNGESLVDEIPGWGCDRSTSSTPSCSAWPTTR